MSEAPDRDPMEDAAHQMNLGGGAGPSDAMRRAYLEEMTSSDLNPATVHMVVNMIASDFMLSNLKDAELHEIKKLREITLKKIKAAHPHPNAIMRGELRPDVCGEDADPLKPLSQSQEVALDQFVRGAFANLARSRDGFQQEQIGKTVNTSEVRKESDDDGGWLSFS